ncbi:MAG: toll/interleukin-1 receptor domain-containing protein [Methylobacter sp.]|nr:toll/interleukin-1 receptor domain-containing protein [Methylobacter sp.]
MLKNPSLRGSIFISYRRADSPGYVRALMSDMRNFFGSKHVFLDMEDIPAGSDFPLIIDEAVSNCELLLALIGPSWIDLRDEFGQRRIENPVDFVRLELGVALAHKIPIIPVLVDNAKVPKPEQLPDQIKQLSTLEGVSLTYDRWDDDIARLFDAIEKIAVEPQVARRYSAALAKLDLGHWQEALTEFEAITSIQPRYLDVPERIKPLRALAGKLSALGPKAGRWQNLASKYPLTLMVIVSLLPNASAAAFNYLFNLEVIVHPMARRGVEQAEHYFQVWAVLVNSIGFLTGIVLFIFFARSVSRGLANVVSGRAVAQQSLTFLRRRCLLLGQYVALISACIWIIAGPIYPLMIGALEFRDYVYFIASLGVCGIFVATYPFLVVTWLCTHVFYPPLLTPGSVAAGDMATLTRIDSLRWRYLAMAGALPMLVLALGLILGPSVGSRWATILLGAGGFVGVAGFVFALSLFQAIQADIFLLKEAALAYANKLDNHETIE